MGILISSLAALKNTFWNRHRDKEIAGDDVQQQQPLPPQQQHDTHTGVRDAQPAVGSVEAAPTALGKTAETGSTATPQQRLAAATNTPPTTTTKGKSTIVSGKGNKNKMASDEDYAAFLDKVNQDPNEGAAKTQGSSSGKVELKAVDGGVKVPATLSKATKEAFYVSDADEPFVPVALKYNGKSLPDEVTFAKLVNHPNHKEADVEILDVAEWDVHGQYKEVVDATREASQGSDVRVYRIGRDGSRMEYWIVGLEGGMLVGAKALAIES